MVNLQKLEVSATIGENGITQWHQCPLLYQVGGFKQPNKNDLSIERVYYIIPSTESILYHHIMIIIMTYHDYWKCGATSGLGRTCSKLATKVCRSMICHHAMVKPIHHPQMQQKWMEWKKHVSTPVMASVYSFIAARVIPQKTVIFSILSSISII